METRHLRLVKAIVEAGSISKAIDQLYLTQSALSHQLRELETQLGTKVFYRVNKKLILTPAGEKILETADKVLDEIDKARVDIHNLITGEKGTIRLRTQCYTSYYWLPGLMKEFHEEHPGINFEIVYDNNESAIDQLKKGILDIAIINFPKPDDQIIVYELFKDELVAVFPEGHKWDGKTYLEPEDFRDAEMFIYNFPKESVVVYEQFLKPAGVEPSRMTPLPLTEATIEMIKAGLGVSVMSLWSIQPYVDSGLVKTAKVGQDGIFRHQYAVLLKENEHPAYYETFIRFMKQSMN